MTRFLPPGRDIALYNGRVAGPGEESEIRRINERLDAIEQRLGRLESARAPRPAPAQLPTPSAAPSRPLEIRFGLTLLNRAGVITFVLGVAFFFKYAVDSRWIGPSGRVLPGAAAGLVALGAADRPWRRDQKTFAQGIAQDRNRRLSPAIA